ncbi:MAG: hypothetical protein K8J08_07265 [Thermoanaerobaculia bacterium]|nr:hypothetical protein [Thermoanaerobaculia bacterium]
MNTIGLGVSGSVQVARTFSPDREIDATGRTIDISTLEIHTTAFQGPW